MSLEPERGLFVFFSYAHQDKRFRDRLEDHLSILKYRGLITTWYDREIRAGEEWAQQINIYLDKAHIILLLISSDFMASEYCYSIEMKRALERHEQREADVIPILLRPVLYTDAPFARLQMLPTRGKPVTRWRDRDSAFLDIAYGIERVALKYSPPSPATGGQDMNDPRNPFGGTNRNSPLNPHGGTNRNSPHIPASLRHSASLNNSANPNYIPRDQVGGRQGWERVRRLTPGGICLVYYAAVYAILLIIVLITAGIFALSQHPTLIPLVIYLFIGLLLLIAGIVVVRKLIEARWSRYDLFIEPVNAVHKRRYYEGAIAAYQHALLRNPSDGYAHRGMGNAFYALERYDKALNAFLQATRYAFTPAAYAGLGNTYAKLRRYSEAVAAYEKAMELDPTVTLNYDVFMQSLEALGREEEAKQVHAKAKQLGYEDDS